MQAKEDWMLVTKMMRGSGREPLQEGEARGELRAIG
jgi:hypothetical protein